MNAAPENLQSVFDRTFAGISQTLENFMPQLTLREVGTVISVATGIAKVSGLPGVGFEELVKFPGDVLGIAFNVDADEIGVVLLGEYQNLHAGDEVERTGRVMDGERVHARLTDVGLKPMGLFAVPNSVQAITPLVGQIQIESEAHRAKGDYVRVYVFHNRPKSGALYEPVSQRLLPLDAAWQKGLAEVPWPAKVLPEVLCSDTVTLRALIREYLFISLFRACAESLASENASRLAAMERADKNIDELLENLHGTFHRLRQAGIDEELFDVIAGFEALSGKNAA